MAQKKRGDGKKFTSGADNPANKQLAPSGLSFGVVIRQAISRRVSEKDIDEMVSAQVKKAKEGDTKAFSELADRMDGKAPQQVIVTDKNNDPLDFSDLTKEIAHQRTVAGQTAAPPKPGTNGTLNGTHRNGIR